MAHSADAPLKVLDATRPHKRRGRNPGKNMNKGIRVRNERIGRPRWQPTRSWRKFRLPRAVQLEAALEELYDFDAPPTFSLMRALDDREDVVAYGEEREHEEIQEVSTRRVRKDIVVRAIEMSRSCQHRQILGSGDSEKIGARLERGRQRLTDVLEEVEDYPRAWVSTDLQLIELELAGQYKGRLALA